MLPFSLKFSCFQNRTIKASNKCEKNFELKQQMYFSLVEHRLKETRAPFTKTRHSIKGNAQFVKKVTFEHLMDFKQNHYGSLKH